MQTVEFQGWGSRQGAVKTPDRLVIDLNADPALQCVAVKKAALQAHRNFTAIGLQSFALLSGGKGIHVIVPLEPVRAWTKVHEFARTFCAALAEVAPERFTLALSKRQRRGRIFLDYLRNQRTATAIVPYLPRARTDKGGHQAKMRSGAASAQRLPSVR